LGNVIADAQLADTAPEANGGAQLALMNPGGIRADLVFAPDGVVTYEEAFTVQLFNNYPGRRRRHVTVRRADRGGAALVARRSRRRDPTPGTVEQRIDGAGPNRSRAEPAARGTDR
jgi:5'-nucleotidase, C-terminal domain